MNMLTYAESGMEYDLMDEFKVAAQRLARQTIGNVARLGFRGCEWSRGESAYLFEAIPGLPYPMIGDVDEGPATKILVADAMYRLTGASYYSHIAQCAVASVVNDIITLGVMPVSLTMHLSAGSADWFEDRNRFIDLLHGWKHACNLARCAWSGGETAILKGSVHQNTFVLSGSAWGIVKSQDHLIREHIRDHDAIVLIESNGIHANGLTLARAIGDRHDPFLRKIAHLFLPQFFRRRALPHGYLTKLSDGRTYGESLLDPTHMYVGLVEECLDQGVEIHYAVNITGHGWRKLMRATGNFLYRIVDLPEPQPIFKFIQRYGPVDDYEMYRTFTMGAGFALYLPNDATVGKVIDIAKAKGLRAFLAGTIEKSDEKKVVIEPKYLEYTADTLEIR